MRVGRLGGGLAVQLPEAIVQALGVNEGDELDVELSGEHSVVLRRSASRDDALAVLRALSRPAPLGYRFDRDQANSRDS